MTDAIPTGNGLFHKLMNRWVPSGKLHNLVINYPIISDPARLAMMNDQWPGGIVWIGNILYVFNPILVRELIAQQLADQKVSQNGGTPVLGRGGTVDTLGRMVMGTSGPITIEPGNEWKILNAALAKVVGYSANMEEILASIVVNADEFVDELLQELKKGVNVDPSPLVKSSSLGMIIQRTLGISLNDFGTRLAEKINIPEFNYRTYLDAVRMALITHMIPSQMGMNIVLPGGRQAVDILGKFTEAYIDIAKDLAASSTTPNLVSILAQKGITEEEQLASIVNQLIAAGHETTAGVLTVGLRELFNQPEVLNKIWEEIRNLNFNSVDIHNSFRILENSELGRFLLELLRLYPATPIIPLSVNKDMILGGYSLSLGTEIQINLIALHTNNAQWGQEAHELKPDRWITGESTKGQSSVARLKREGIFLPFWAGPRSCVGENFAIAELYITLGKFIQSVFETGAKISVMSQGIIETSTGTSNLVGFELRIT